MSPKALAAAVTPFQPDGEVDQAALGPLIRFLAEGGMDGILALGTTGEGILLAPQERERVAEGFVREAPRGFEVLVHCGAQTTADTVRLCRHARTLGVAGVAVIAPPYFPLDDRSLLAHLEAAAQACAPVPFYVYEFAARSGYAVPPRVIDQLGRLATNLRGLKVSDSPFDAVRPYLGSSLEVFVGFEPLVLQGMEHGSAGAVSGLATAFPRLVARLVHERSLAAHEELGRLRSALEPFPFHGACKVILGALDVPVSPHVRGPLRPLTEEERSEVLEILASAPSDLREPTAK